MLEVMDAADWIEDVAARLLLLNPAWPASRAVHVAQALSRTAVRGLPPDAAAQGALGGDTPSESVPGDTGGQAPRPGDDDGPPTAGPGDPSPDDTPDPPADVTPSEVLAAALAGAAIGFATGMASGTASGVTGALVGAVTGGIAIVRTGGECTESRPDTSEAEPVA
jgi:hypothetical protein